MIRAIIYAVLVCGIMTIGLVALDLNKHKPVSVAPEKKERSGVDKQPPKKDETAKGIPSKAKAAKAVPTKAVAEKSEEDQVKPNQISQKTTGITLTALIKGLRSDKGQIIAQLFDSSDAFNNNRYDQAVRTLVIPAKNFSGELNFSQLPRGEYALVLFHDENNNQQFDQTGSLIEGYAYSANLSKTVAAKTTAVHFRQAAFNADSDKKLNISLIYH
ncbi:DUF2141 domain-containing protein [Neptuniibacter sp. SY11_33]|uniref:DUF2141 domain-containing protein n=1 Tax=Neptuniibacter sp. SY11_33 TaxID=3398215 RepID=UPI0039F55FD6